MTPGRVAVGVDIGPDGRVTTAVSRWMPDGTLHIDMLDEVRPFGPQDFGRARHVFDLPGAAVWIEMAGRRYGKGLRAAAAAELAGLQRPPALADLYPPTASPQAVRNAVDDAIRRWKAKPALRAAQMAYLRGLGLPPLDELVATAWAGLIAPPLDEP